ncbi:MAG TPA: hypothetical protein VF651_09450 [Gammaproteobacteria bacterium]
MKSSQIRDLARRYATGKLSQESYRSQRRSLIDSVTGGQVQLSYRENERAAARPRFNTKLLGITAVVLIMAGIGTVLLIKRSNHAASAAGAAPAQAPSVPALPPDPGPELVRTFMEANDWTDGSLQNFTRHWATLGADGQTQARESLMYPRLVSAVRQQMDSEKAVAGPASPHLMELQKVAKSLGIPTS